LGLLKFGYSLSKFGFKEEPAKEENPTKEVEESLVIATKVMVEEIEEVRAWISSVIKIRRWIEEN
jgi:hypothetical protein